MFSFEKVLEDLFDKGLGVFDRVIDFELKDREFELAKDLEIFRSAQAFEAEQRRRQFFDPNPSGGFSGNASTLLLIGAIGVGAILLLRK